MSQSEQFVQMYVHVGNILLIKNRFNHLCFQYILFVVSYVLVEKKLFFILLCTSRENGIRLNSFWTIGRVVFNEIGSFDMDNVIMSYISKINNQIGTKIFELNKRLIIHIMFQMSSHHHMSNAKLPHIWNGNHQRFVYISKERMSNRGKILCTNCL